MSTSAPRAARQRKRLEGDVKNVIQTTLATSATYYLLQKLLTRFVTPFDSSHLVASPPSLHLRWDALHFLEIAKHGYQFEQHLAFQPGWQGILHILQRCGNALLGAAVLNTLARVGANVALFKLTDLIHGREMARVTSLLYAFPPAPAVLAAPYTETLYACFTFTGLYLLARRRNRNAAILFALATTLRSTGVFASLILVITILVPILTQSTFARGFGVLTQGAHVAGLCLLVVSPFLAFQAYTYASICKPNPTRPWCNNFLPLSYSFVQKEYWNIGPFRYWKVEQIPNFILAAPVIGISIYGAIKFLRRGNMNMQRGWESLNVAINVHSLVMTALLVFASHTQIALRLAPTDPVLWWALARSVVEKGNSRLIRYWVWWVCIWGAVSLVLWAGHYPPA